MTLGDVQSLRRREVLPKGLGHFYREFWGYGGQRFMLARVEVVGTMWPVTQQGQQRGQLKGTLGFSSG